MDAGDYKIRNPVTRARLFGYWAPAILWAALLLSLGGETASAQNTGSLLATLLGALFDAITYEQAMIIHWAIRKSAHIVAYAILGWLNFRALRAGRPGWSLRWSVVAVLMALAVAIADELHQAMSPQRTAALADVAFDLWGAVVSQFLVRGRRR
jgi:VanZ family protein